MGFEKGAMAPRLVGAATEQRDWAGGGATAHLRDGGLGLGARESREIARHVLLPADPLVEIRAQQLGHRTELLEPDGYALLADAAGPETHDQHALAVVGRRRVVDALGRDVHLSLAASGGGGRGGRAS